ncbi:MAG: 2-C-methyl-D-erythritol 4-phosphate cytidylyltransferase [bacterium]
MPERTSAIIVAAGTGERMASGGVPKQYLELSGAPLLCWSALALSRSRLISELLVVSAPEWMDKAREIMTKHCPAVSCRMVAGGNHRQESVRCGLDAAPEAELVLVHDAARPFVSADLADRTLQAARQEGAATASLRPADTVKLLDPETGKDRNLPRERLRIIQTPQSFRADMLRQAHEAGQKDSYQATDDTDLVERLGHKTVMVEGSPFNLKITNAADWDLARALIASGLVPAFGETGEKS